MGRSLNEVRDELYDLDHEDQVALMQRFHLKEEHLDRLEAASRLERAGDEHEEHAQVCGVCGDIRADNVEVDLFWHPRAALELLEPAIA